jgi:hypothetical protein
MQPILSISELKLAIELLEIEKAIKEQSLKEQFYITYETFKPVNLLKSSLSDVAKNPSLIDSILGNLIGYSSGYLTRKILVGDSSNGFRNLLGSLLQFGVSRLLTQHADDILSFGRNMIQNFLRKREMKSSDSD